MNRLNFGPLGGVELHQDDLEFWDDANRQAFDMLARAIGNGQPFRYGFRVLQSPGAPGAITWSILADGPSAFLYAKGELFLVAIVGVTGPSGLTPYFALLEEFDPAGAEFNVPGDPIQTYINRRATIRLSANPTAEADFLSITAIPTPSIVRPGYTSGSIFLSSQFDVPNSATPPKWVLDYNGRISLTGSVRAVVNSPIFLTSTSLPEHLRPGVGRSMPVVGERVWPGADGNSAFHSFVLSVGPTGLMSIRAYGEWGPSIDYVRAGDVINIGGASWIVGL